jgi:hypothetical protein
LSAGRAYLAGFANKGVAGYFAGGRNFTTNANLSTVDKYSFSDDSRTTLGTGLSAAKFGVIGLSNSTVAGYVGGGTDGSYLTTIEKFAYPSDTRSTLGTGLSTARATPAGFADERF